MLLTSTLIATLVLAVATILLLALGKRLRFASIPVSLVLAGLVSAGAAWAASELYGLVDAYAWVAAAIIGGACLLVILLVPYWNPVGQLFLGAYLAAAGCYLALGSYLTFASGLSIWGRIASIVLLLLEFLALLISGYFVFEGCDRLCRARPSRTIAPPDPAYLPKVSLQVPAYNEPAGMVIETVKSLERIDYPNLEILVVDNNTPDPETWAPVKEYCEGRPRVRFVHIVADGFKAGALNVVMEKHLDDDVELIGVIDADYQVDEGYLREVVGYFADPRVAFVQTPQDYREWEGDTYLTACYDAYSYFFHASMPSRDQRNSIIFAGTMGLIRRRTLQRLGGWPEWCITEDSETSLRMLKAGHQGVYLERPMGRGIMPLTFSALKSQRFRWCFGGIQIVRRHWRSLMPGPRTETNRLSIGQRLDYLFGTGLVWFNDVLYLGFTGILLATAYLMVAGEGSFFRPLTGALILLPAALLLSGVMRALWSLRQLTGIGSRRSLLALLNWLSLSWTVAMAALQGVVRKRAVFMRTPKTEEGQQNVWSALRAAKVETTLSVLLLASGVAAVYNGAVFLAFLFLWQSVVYGSSPFMSWLSTRTILSPELERRRLTEWRRERVAALIGYYATGAAALAGIALIAALFFMGGVNPGRIPALPQLPQEPGTSAPPPTAPATAPASPGSTAEPTSTPSTPSPATTTPGTPTTPTTSGPPQTSAPAPVPPPTPTSS